MSTHNIGFYEDLTKLIFEIIIKYHQIRTLFLLLLSSGFLTRSNTNQAVQPQKMTRGLKFGFWKQRDCSSIYVGKKGADQLHDYHTADLPLCFHICKMQVFS